MDWMNQDEVFTYANAIGAAEPNTKKQKPNSKPLALQKNFEQCGLITREEELTELGPPKVPRSACFGCCYIGEIESGAASYEEVSALMKIIRKCISKMDPISMSIDIAERYRNIQLDVNSNLGHGEKPLPDWDAASILEHIRYHNTDPEIQTWTRIVEHQELAKIALHASVVRNIDTGELQIDEKQAKMYIEFVKSLETLTKSDPSKKLYYSGGSHFDTKAASEGPIAFSGKTIVSYLREKAK
jgi:hypothetical protein